MFQLESKCEDSYNDVLSGETAWSDLGQVSTVEQQQHRHGGRPSTQLHHESSEWSEGHGCSLFYLLLAFHITNANKDF